MTTGIAYLPHGVAGVRLPVERLVDYRRRARAAGACGLALEPSGERKLANRSSRARSLRPRLFIAGLPVRVRERSFLTIESRSAPSCAAMSASACIANVLTIRLTSVR